MARLVRSALAVAARVVRPVVPVASTAVRAASTAAGFLTLDTLNKNVRQAQYAVRGEIVTKALAIAKELQSGKHTRPFDKVVYCNIGNPHELKQQPITFFRQVFALVNYPQLLDDPRVGDIFPADAIARARKYVAAIPGGTGAYTNSQGLECIREDVAAFITRRDGYKALAKDIFLTDGASPGVQMLIRAMIRTPSDAIMIPMPQYPLYSASLALYGGSRADYMLDEEKGWSLQVSEARGGAEEEEGGACHINRQPPFAPHHPSCLGGVPRCCCSRLSWSGRCPSRSCRGRRCAPSR